jgi:D-glycero-alpha-D-manno-heptose 1-phosphate guanylyltransferase
MPSSKSPWPDAAVILAGGTGTRLGSLTATTPKPLLAVGGRPFLSHLLDHLIAQRIKRVIIATGHLAGEFEKTLGQHYGSMAVGYSREDHPLGTGGATALALGRLDGPAAFVLNGDTFFPAELSPLAAAHATTGASLSLVLRRCPDVARYGSVTLEGDHVASLHEKGAAGPGLINGGVYLVNRADLLADSAGAAFSLERDLLPRWIGRGIVGAVVSDAYFVDIGIPEDLERARRDLA